MMMIMMSDVNNNRRRKDNTEKKRFFVVVVGSSSSRTARLHKLSINQDDERQSKPRVRHETRRMNKKEENSQFILALVSLRHDDTTVSSKTDWAASEEKEMFCNQKLDTLHLLVISSGVDLLDRPNVLSFFQ